MARWCVLLLLSTLAVLAVTDPVPLVLWHGMGDSCCNPLSLGKIQKAIEDKIPGIYVWSIQIGNNFEEDTLNGFFMNVNKQIDMVCANATSNPKLSRGFNSMGFSQGGQFLRALVQRCPNITMHNLISVGGQHQGVYGLPRCIGDNYTLCNAARRLINIGAYISVIQDTVVQAEYWHDPLNEDEYKKDCVFLPDINQENAVNADYKQRLMKLANLVLVKFTEDTMVQPRESEWFGFYKPGQTKEMYTMEESPLYTEDKLGLKSLNEAGRIKFVEAPFNHLQFTEEWFFDNLLQYFNTTFPNVREPVNTF